MNFLIIDDHGLVRDAMDLLLQEIDPNTDVVKCRSLEEALDVLESDDNFDLILLDLKLPGMSGLEGLMALKKAAAHIKTVIFSGYYTKQDVLNGFEQGVAGFIPKSLEPERMKNAITMVLGGDRYIPSDILLDGNSAPDTSDTSLLIDLTERQVQVLDHLIAGKTNKEIAREIGVEEVTVKLHVRHVFQKLGARNRADAVRIAIGQGGAR